MNWPRRLAALFVLLVLAGCAQGAMGQAGAPNAPNSPGNNEIRPEHGGGDGGVGRWDCINAPQRERAKESRFAACASLLTSPAQPQTAAKVRGFSLIAYGS